MADNYYSTGLSLDIVLTIIFVVLKLIGEINWSWWWVLSPLLISFGLGIFILLIFLLVVWVTKI